MALLWLKQLAIFSLLALYLVSASAHEFLYDTENLPAAPQASTLSPEEITLVMEDNPAAPPAEIEAMKESTDKPLEKPKKVEVKKEKAQAADPKAEKGAAQYTAAFRGSWELQSDNAGVSAMHVNIMPVTNRAVMYDATILGPSLIKLTDEQGCRVVDAATKETDCWAHAVEYNTETAEVRPLKVDTDTWCSSGSLTIEGALVSVGGNKEGSKTVRYLSPCVDCEWREYPNSLADARWYATQAILADNRYIIVGGRAAFSYEFMPMEGKKNEKAIDFPFLRETTEDAENNLYPFVHLSTDGNVWTFANDRSIMLDPYANKILHEYPKLPGGSRNYPASGMSALLPLKLDDKPGPDGHYKAEVLVCGGALHEAYDAAMKQDFMPALDDCNRLEISDPNAQWRTEKMPSPRVLGDMLILPNADILMLNGAKRGTAAWGFAEDPNLTPVIYSPAQPEGDRFAECEPSKIARMYHSSSAVLIDTKILVAGSNTHDHYTFEAKYPTEVRVERFSPPYLAPDLRNSRPEIIAETAPKNLAFGATFELAFQGEQAADKNNMRVTMYQPAFTTHGVNMNQRLLVLEVPEMKEGGNKGEYTMKVVAPEQPSVAPAGYYMLFLSSGVVPSNGIWVQLKD